MWNGIISISILEHWVVNDSIPKRKMLSSFGAYKVVSLPTKKLYFFFSILHLA
jgi:hypothetical protein